MFFKSDLVYAWYTKTTKNIKIQVLNGKLLIVLLTKKTEIILLIQTQQGSGDCNNSLCKLDVKGENIANNDMLKTAEVPAIKGKNRQNIKKEEPQCCTREKGTNKQDSVTK